MDNSDRGLDEVGGLDEVIVNEYNIDCESRGVIDGTEYYPIIIYLRKTEDGKPRLIEHKVLEIQKKQLAVLNEYIKKGICTENVFRQGRLGESGNSGLYFELDNEYQANYLENYLFTGIKSLESSGSEELMSTGIDSASNLIRIKPDSKYNQYLRESGMDKFIRIVKYEDELRRQYGDLYRKRGIYDSSDKYYGSLENKERYKYNITEKDVGVQKVLSYGEDNYLVKPNIENADRYIDDKKTMVDNFLVKMPKRHRTLFIDHELSEYFCAAGGSVLDSIKYPERRYNGDIDVFPLSPKDAKKHIKEFIEFISEDGYVEYSRNKHAINIVWYPDEMILLYRSVFWWIELTDYVNMEDNYRYLIGKARKARLPRVKMIDEESNERLINIYLKHGYSYKYELFSKSTTNRMILPSKLIVIFVNFIESGLIDKLDLPRDVLERFKSFIDNNYKAIIRRFFMMNKHYRNNRQVIIKSRLSNRLKKIVLDIVDDITFEKEEEEVVEEDEDDEDDEDDEEEIDEEEKAFISEVNNKEEDFISEVEKNKQDFMETLNTILDEALNIYNFSIISEILNKLPSKREFAYQLTNLFNMKHLDSKLYSEGNLDAKYEERLNKIVNLLINGSRSEDILEDNYRKIIIALNNLFELVQTSKGRFGDELDEVNPKLSKYMTYNNKRRDVSSYATYNLSASMAYNDLMSIFAAGKTHYQIILQRNTSILEVLSRFDVDCCCAAFYRGKIYETKRFRHAIRYKSNVIDPTRQSPSYIFRLMKYAKRNFGIIVPSLEKDKIIDKPYALTMGLSKLATLARRLSEGGKYKKYMYNFNKRFSKNILVYDGLKLLEDEIIGWLETGDRAQASYGQFMMSDTAELIGSIDSKTTPFYFSAYVSEIEMKYYFSRLNYYGANTVNFVDKKYIKTITNDDEKTEITTSNDDEKTETYGDRVDKILENKQVNFDFDDRDRLKLERYIRARTSDVLYVTKYRDEVYDMMELPQNNFEALSRNLADYISENQDRLDYNSVETFIKLLATVDFEDRKVSRPLHSNIDADDRNMSRLTLPILNELRDVLITFQRSKFKYNQRRHDMYVLYPILSGLSYDEKIKQLEELILNVNNTIKSVLSETGTGIITTYVRTDDYLNINLYQHLKEVSLTNVHQLKKLASKLIDLTKIYKQQYISALIQYVGNKHGNLDKYKNEEQDIETNDPASIYNSLKPVDEDEYIDDSAIIDEPWLDPVDQEKKKNNESVDERLNLGAKSFLKPLEDIRYARRERPYFNQLVDNCFKLINLIKRNFKKDYDYGEINPTYLEECQTAIESIYQYINNIDPRYKTKYENYLRMYKMLPIEIPIENNDRTLISIKYVGDDESRKMSYLRPYRLRYELKGRVKERQREERERQREQREREREQRLTEASRNSAQSRFIPTNRIQSRRILTNRIQSRPIRFEIDYIKDIDETIKAIRWDLSILQTNVDEQVVIKNGDTYTFESPLYLYNRRSQVNLDPRIQKEFIDAKDYYDKKLQELYLIIIVSYAMLDSLNEDDIRRDEEYMKDIVSKNLETMMVLRSYFFNFSTMSNAIKGAYKAFYDMIEHDYIRVINDGLDYDIREPMSNDIYGDHSYPLTFKIRYDISNSVSNAFKYIGHSTDCLGVYNNKLCFNQRYLESKLFKLLILDPAFRQDSSFERFEDPIYNDLIYVPIPRYDVTLWRDLRIRNNYHRFLFNGQHTNIAVYDNNDGEQNWYDKENYWVNKRERKTITYDDDSMLITKRVETIENQRVPIKYFVDFDEWNIKEPPVIEDYYEALSKYVKMALLNSKEALSIAANIPYNEYGEFILE